MSFPKRYCVHLYTCIYCVCTQIFDLHLRDLCRSRSRSLICGRFRNCILYVLYTVFFSNPLLSYLENGVFFPPGPIRWHVEGGCNYTGLFLSPIQNLWSHLRVCFYIILYIYLREIDMFYGFSIKRYTFYSVLQRKKHV